MNHMSICSDEKHQKDPLDNFCITCHIEIANISKLHYETYYIQSNQLIQFGLYDEALNFVEIGIQINLSIEDTYNKIGDALRRLNNETDATFYYKEGFDIKRNNILLLEAKSVILLMQERQDEAFVCVEEIQDLIKYQNQYPNELLSCLNKFQKSNSEGQEKAFSFRGQLLIDKKQYQEALQSYDAALKINPIYIEALNGKGNTLLKLQKYEEALKCYDAALKIDLQNTSALNGKGSTLKALHKYEEALKCYDAALKIDPQLSESLNNKGNTLNALHKYEEALKCYDTAFKINPQLSEALNGQATTLLKLQKPEQALKFIDASLKIKPLDSEIITMRGFILLSLDKTNDALECFQQALRISPESIHAQHGIDLILKDNRADIQRNQIQTQTQNNLDQDELINKGKHLLQTNQLKEALIIFDKLLTVNQQPEVIFYKAQTLFQLKRYEEALIYCDISESLGLYQDQTKQLLEKILSEMINFQ